MATVKEVKLMDGEDQVTPYTLIDSVWYPNGTQFKENVYTKDQVYTKSEINDRRLKTYTLPGTIDGIYRLVLDPMEVGDMAYVKGDFTINAHGGWQIHDGGGNVLDKEYLMYVHDMNFPESPIIEWRVKARRLSSAEYLYQLYPNLDYSFKSYARLFIIRTV